MCGPSSLIYIQLSWWAGLSADMPTWESSRLLPLYSICKGTSSTVYTMDLLATKLQPIEGSIRSTVVMFMGLWVNPAFTCTMYMQCRKSLLMED